MDTDKPPPYRLAIYKPRSGLYQTYHTAGTWDRAQWEAQNLIQPSELPLAAIRLAAGIYSL